MSRGRDIHIKFHVTSAYKGIKYISFQKYCSVLLGVNQIDVYEMGGASSTHVNV
jgi:hypothetical protein